MVHLTKIVVWLCKKFNRTQLEFIVSNLQEVLDNKITDIKPKDDFKEKHPNYRNFYVDPTPPILGPAKSREKQDKDWKSLLDELKKKGISS